MTALMWETALLLLGAYFLGAWVACIIRRMATASDDVPVGVETVAPAVAGVAVQETAAVNRYESALSGQGRLRETEPLPTEPLRTQPAAAEPLVLPPARAGSPPVVPRTPDAATLDIASTSLPAASSSAARSGVSAPETGARIPTGVVAAGAGVAATAALVAAGGSAPTVAKAVDPDDLTRIRGVDAGMEERLQRLGVTRYAEIAGWTSVDVDGMTEALGIPGRIARENWIEQAQILAAGGQTRYTQSLRDGVGLDALEPASAPVDGGARPVVRVPAVSRVSMPTVGENTTSALGGAAAAAATATAVGLAAASTGDVRAETDSDAPVSGAASAGRERDDLQRIAGINGEVERLLNIQGVGRYDQIAKWDRGDIAKFDGLLGASGRVERENWVEQAGVLAAGGTTAYARQLDRRAAVGAGSGIVPASLGAAIGARARSREADAAPSGPRRNDIAGLRSVRSEAYRGEEASEPGAASASRAEADDLKRIRGVGVLIERRLNALGVYRYDQVANWSGAEVQRISDQLDFRGRIERENWVEQARILAAGGHTEFSRRVDRGEIDSSRGSS
jgi:predicted flap endonuclease-1-like 5' DNA nuclease